MNDRILVTHQVHSLALGNDMSLYGGNYQALLRFSSSSFLLFLSSLEVFFLSLSGFGVLINDNAGIS